MHLNPIFAITSIMTPFSNMSTSFDTKVTKIEV